MIKCVSNDTFFRVMYMKLDILGFFTEVFLFDSVKPETLSNLIDDISPEIKEFSHREIIYSPNDYEKKIGFIVRGECIVEQLKSDGKAVPLNVLRRADSFGIMAVLSDEGEFPTRITAVKDSTVVFITNEKLLLILKKYPAVAMNLIYFLSAKIAFLNKKISTFTSVTVEDKLANFLLQEYRRLDSFEIPFSCQKAAKSINAGRASLYRAITALSESNIIKLENKKIYILNPQGLERN